MAEVRSTPRCGLRAVSTFSGAGGSCLGFRLAGFEVLWASEFVDIARQTYEANFPGVPVDGRDIRAVEPGEILEAIGLKEGELDLLDGSPPCASFSMAGKREGAWGEVRKYSETRQRVDDLFFEFARILRGLRPRAFVAENVRGLVIGKAKGYFKEILAELTGCGYVVRAKLLDAQWLGVPQARQRLFFVGMRDDLGLEPAFPRPLPYRYTVREAIADLLGLTSRVIHDTRGQPQYSGGDITDRPSTTILQGGAGSFKVVGMRAGHRRAGAQLPDHDPAPTVMADGIGGVGPHQLGIECQTSEASIERFAIGREAASLKQGEQSDRYFNLVRAHSDELSPTVTQTGGVLGAASVVHPSGARKFTIAELRRICSFPDDFELPGTYRQQWERLGRAVPPLMMMRIAQAIRDRLLGGS